ncbi:MAG: lipoyl(octanoyl) transferase LipB [Gammaproteobacteria bacterium]|nr:lipoyl(octanoyl) transferase LipB [Gammaproteobacteria bacterium]
MIIKKLGIQPYIPIWEKMQQFTDQRDDQTEDELWVLQHPPVFTLGRHSDESHILHRGKIPIQKIDRGGQVTYHGPGQLIIYCLLDLKRLKLGVRQVVTVMEDAVIDFLSLYEVNAYAKEKAPGVYTAEGKISALGLRVRKGKCYHGLSVNIDMNLQPFQSINPCGYANLDVVQLSDYTDQVSLPKCGQQLSQALHEHLQIFA